jgi:hypothetical protein
MRFLKQFFKFSIVLCLNGCTKDETNPIPAAGLVAKIMLDGNGMDEVHQTVAVNHHAVFVADRHGETNHAVHFSRSDSAFLDFGDVAAYSFPQNIFTTSCWVMVEDTSQPIAILSKRTAVGPFEYSLDNHFSKAIFNFDNWIASGATTVYGTDPLDASAPIKLNQWQHIAVVADGVTLRVYSNGELMPGLDSIKAGNSFSDTDAPFQIGAGGGYGKNYFFNGAIDDLLIYNRALSEEEIKTLSEL